MAYLDGELAPEQAVAVASHLEECPDCAALADELRRVSHQMRAWQVPPSPDTLGQQMLSRVDPPTGRKFWSPAKPRSFFRRWSWQLAGGFALILLVAAITTPILLREWMVAYKIQTSPADFSLSQPRTSATNIDPYQAQMPDSGRVGGGGGSRGERKNKAHAPDASAPMIVRTAALTIVAKDFSAARAAVERIVDQHGGYVADLNTTTPKDAAQTLTVTLRIPAPQLDAALAELKKLGRIEQEMQSGEDVTKQHTDLVARLKNARASEQRLVEILRQRPGKVSEVLEVEQEISRVREEIEQMEAGRKDLEKRVQFSTVQLRLVEEYKEQLNVTPPSTGTRLRNALVSGYRDAVDSIIAFLLFLLSAGPTLLLWLAILFLPARWAWRRWLPHHAANQ